MTIQRLVLETWRWVGDYQAGSGTLTLLCIGCSALAGSNIGLVRVLLLLRPRPPLFQIPQILLQPLAARLATFEWNLPSKSTYAQQI
jgi:hypothetical protein